MGYQHKKRSPKGAIHEYKKGLYERKKRKQARRPHGVLKEQHVTTERQIAELTLKELHTLGNQRFGSSPFSDHFDRWLMNVAMVLNEFKAHPTIGVDDQFAAECAKALDAVKLQLGNIRRKEALVEQETKKLSDQRMLLKKVDAEYVAAATMIRAQKNAKVRRLNQSISLLKKEQDRIIRLKTGFFRGISKKERERMETAIVDELNDKQRELEVTVLDFNAQQKRLREENDRKREPILEQIKQCKKTIGNMERDDSLEERWFACEALVDAVNSFLQRKAALPH